MKNDGGLVFPVNIMDFQPCTGEQVVREQEYGMTLRNYAAIKLSAAWVPALAARYEMQGYSDAYALVHANRLAIEQANALIAKLEKGEEND